MQKNKLPPNTLTNADGTPYAANWERTHCFVCADRGDQLCIVCEQSVCQQHIASDLQPGEHVICVECDKNTPNREQAYQHYLLRTRLRMDVGIMTVNEARQRYGLPTS